jgi:uncharacterized membrane protein YgcG
VSGTHETACFFWDDRPVLSTAEGPVLSAVEGAVVPTEHQRFNRGGTTTGIASDVIRPGLRCACGRGTTFFLALAIGLIFASRLTALEIPALKPGINDFAKMMPQASLDDLDARLNRFKTESGYTVALLTIKSLEGENIKSFGRRAFTSLPLEDKDRPRSVLLIVARKEQEVSIQAGKELQQLFSEPDASRNLQAQVKLYFNGLRPDLGIYGAVNYIFKVIKGEVHVGRKTEEEVLEDASTRGVGAGAIFAVLLAPYLAFLVGMLWGIYGTKFGVRRETRLFVGAILGGGTARIVATLMELMGRYSDSLWYFILALSIIGGVFGSLTEFWMSGEWSGIPRVKDKRKRKPEDNIGI